MSRFLPILSLLSLLSFASCSRQQETSPPATASPAVSSIEKQDNVPEQALVVLRHVRETGRPPEGYVGGRVFENRERNLPPGGHYHEYDVNPKVKGKNRGPERLVVDEASGKAWYTPDHYRTFILIQ
jgi:ribonuclease T1